MIQYIKELTKADDIIILESTEEGKNLRVNKNEYTVIDVKEWIENDELLNGQLQY